ncbi:hypothetical protein ACQPZJ_49625 [Actinoplanes sp. CA-054009]
MQPQEPATGAVPPPDLPRQPAGGVTPPAPEKPRKARNPRRRLWLAVGAGILALLCLGGVGVAVLLYDEETKIDRAAPDQVTSSFLRGYLSNRSDEESALYTCKSGAKLEAIEALRNEMIQREQKFGTSVSAVWESLSVSGGDQTKSVEVDLVISGSANGKQVSSRTESWSFTLVDEDGWRVCGANKVG